MNTVAPPFASNARANRVFGGAQNSVLPRVHTHPTEAHDSKAVDSSHPPVRTAALRGAGAGVIVGTLAFGILLLIAGVNIFELRYLTLYLSGIAFSAACWSIIFTLWNLGRSHEV